MLGFARWTDAYDRRMAALRVAEIMGKRPPGAPRAAHLTVGAGRNYLYDDDGNLHEANIDRAAAAGIASGCGTWKYCPSALVTCGPQQSTPKSLPRKGRRPPDGAESPRFARLRSISTVS